MKRIFIFLLVVLSLVFTSCLTATGTSYTSSTQSSSTNNGSFSKTTTSSKSRDLILDGKTYFAEIIDEMGGITSWYCTDWYTSSGNKVLLEVGYFNNYDTIGFILYDGTNKGTREGVYHHREGLDHRWNWGADKNGAFRYSFLIESDGTASYYHFLDGEDTAKPSSLYKAHKR